MYVSRSDDQPAWFVGMGKTVNAPNPTAVFKYDARTAELIHALPQQQGVMYVIRALHVELLAGLPGTLFVGAVGLCFVAALVSGVVLYAPFMRKLAFGTVRGADRGAARDRPGCAGSTCIISSASWRPPGWSWSACRASSTRSPSR